MTQVVPDGWKERFMERGRAEGEAKGRLEATLENALNLLRENVAIETISRCLGLSMEKVREPAAGLKKG